MIPLFTGSDGEPQNEGSHRRLYAAARSSRMENVALTPHCGTGSLGCRTNLAAVTAGNIITFMPDGKTRNVLN